MYISYVYVVFLKKMRACVCVSLPNDAAAQCVTTSHLYSPFISSTKKALSLSILSIHTHTIHLHF